MRPELPALTRRRAVRHPHVTLEQRAFVYAQTVGLDSPEDPCARAEHNQARVGDIAAQFTQH